MILKTGCKRIIFYSYVSANVNAVEQSILHRGGFECWDVLLVHLLRVNG